jgi:hypothetical protein
MRPARIALLVLAAAAVGATVGLLVLGRDDEETPRPDRGARTMRIAAALEPSVHLFGDPIVARLDLLFDKRRVDPERITVDSVFEPFEQVGQERRERSEVGDVVRLRISFPLQCLTRTCAPVGARREIQLPPVRVVYVLTDARVRANDVAEWPPVDVASRLGAFDVQEARWRADLEPPAVSYGMSPGWLGAVLWGSALALVLAAGLLGWRLFGGRPDADAELVPVETRPPLERALEQLGLVSANGDAPARRRALERLARELERVEEPGLAARARRLAWSPQTPERPEVDRLARDVRGSVEGER